MVCALCDPLCLFVVVHKRTSVDTDCHGLLLVDS